MRKVIFAAMLVAAGPATGQSITGNELLRACEAQDLGILDGFCTGYILGAWEGMSWGTFAVFHIIGAGPAEGGTEAANDFMETILQACPHADVENSQLVDVVTRHLVAHPEIRQQSARSLIHVALMEAFPCPGE